MLKYVELSLDTFRGRCQFEFYSQMHCYIIHPDLVELWVICDKYLSAHLLNLVPTEGSAVFNTLEGAAGHSSDFLLSSPVRVNHHTDESSDCPCNVISKTTLKPHKSQDIICISHSGIDGLYFIGCRVEHPAIANPSCNLYSSHHGDIFTEPKDNPTVQES